MIPKEQIAHGLTMVYLSNKYGVDVNEFFSVDSNLTDSIVSSIFGSGTVETKYFEDVNTSRYIKVKTGHKNFLGFEKKKKVQSGCLIDDVFSHMIEDYYQGYTRFIEMLEKK